MWRDDDVMAGTVGILLLCVLVGVPVFMGAVVAITRPVPVEASTPSPVNVWRDENGMVAVVTYRTPTNVLRCYLLNAQGGQPIQIECPK